MSALKFIDAIKNKMIESGANKDTEIAFIFKEENGQYRHCHSVKEMFIADPQTHGMNNTIIIELQK